MKIEVKGKKMFVILSQVVGMPFFYAIGIGLIMLFIIVFVESLQNTLGWILIFFGPLLYMGYIILDAKISAENTYMELNSKSVDVHFQNIRSNGNLTLPINEISSVTVSQSFIRKLFGICQVNIIQNSGAALSSWGYSYREATEFAKQFSEKYHIPVSKNT